jgi:hypothetical protein
MTKPAECGCWMPRAKTTCKRQHGHKGCHRAKVWYCDACQRPVIGPPTGRDDEHCVCFMCMLDDLKYYGQIPRRKRA